MGLGRWNFFGTRRTIHEATLRAWCRLAFLVCAALPVALTLIACMLEYIPLYQQQRASRYAQQLMHVTGLVVKVQRVELLEPGKRILHNIELIHPETGEPLGRMLAMWISETPTGCAIRAHQPQIDADHLKDLVEIVHQHVLCRPTIQGHATVLCMDGLVLNGSPERQFDFKVMRCEVRRSAATTTARCTFEKAGVAGNSAELTFTRQHTDAIPTSRLTLNTGGQRLPGHWVNHFAPQYALPGAEATLRDSSLALEFNHLGWSLRGQCRLQRVDATSWFDRPVLSGQADVEITALAMTDRNLEKVAGKLLVQNGQIHADIVSSAHWIGINPTPQAQKDLSVSGANNQLSFTKLECKFGLDARGLQLEPIMRQLAIAMDELGPILLYNGAEPNYCIPQSNLVLLFSLQYPLQDNKVLESPMVKRLVQWLPGSQSPEARTARAFNN